MAEWMKRVVSAERDPGATNSKIPGMVAFVKERFQNR